MGRPRTNPEIKQYGKLTPIKFSHLDKSKHSFWKFKCECGNESIANLSKVMIGSIQSCGCLSKREYGAASFRHLVNYYIVSGKSRGYSFELDDEQFRILTKQNCYYCGKEPSNLIKNNHNNGDYYYNGLDRIDNNKGYTFDNVLTSCRDCNWLRGDRLTVEETKVAMEAIKKLRESK